jgi:hypothetical protein
VNKLVPLDSKHNDEEQAVHELFEIEIVENHWSSHVQSNHRGGNSEGQAIYLCLGINEVGCGFSGENLHCRGIEELARVAIFYKSFPNWPPAVFHRVK